MGQTTMIAIQAVGATPAPAAGAGCQACVHGGAQPVCRTTVGEPCAAPQLSGPPQELQRVLAALGAGLGFDPEAPELGGIGGLHLGPGEAELQLTVPPHCGGAALAANAFDLLRGLLPDTDIYVTHRA